VNHAQSATVCGSAIDERPQKNSRSAVTAANDARRGAAFDHYFDAVLRVRR
jgi:hypothetical protein